MWLEVAVETASAYAECIADLLQQYGHQGVLIERAGFMPETWEDEVPPADVLTVRAYLPIDAHTPDLQQQLCDLLHPLIPQFSQVDEQDWAEAWKQHYHPFRLGRRLYIRPRWIELEDVAPDDIVLSLDPGQAFGTGTHDSTRLCLLATEDLMQNGWSVLDMGCGSGILSIAAVKLGATKVLALDIDPVAVRVTQENAELNGVADHIQAQQGSLETVLGSARRFDFLLVNILAKVIIQMCQQGLGQAVRPGGVAVFAGIIETQVDEVENALRQTGLEPYRRRASDEWVVIEARRPH